MNFKLLRSVPVLAALLAIAALGAAFDPGTARAQQAPPGAAQNLAVVGQRCSGGNVEVFFAWAPSGQGTQWFDISQLSNFAGWANQGPLSPQTATTAWRLNSNTVYFARVSTFTAQGLRISNTLPFQTIFCAAGFTPPSNVNANVFNDFVRLTWNRGNGNIFFCVDTAFTQSDLLNFRNSWRNWGCGTTATQLDLTQLACGRQHFARVWAAGSGISGHSGIESFVSQDCDFSPPSDPRAQARSDGTVLFRWDRGEDNHFFCVDFALTQSDLRNFTGSWGNAACGTTGTSATVSGLQCGQQYFYRIWAAGTSESGYTPIDTVTTAACDFEPPDDLTVSVGGPGAVTFSWDEEDPALWFCVDVAASQADLLNFSGTWRNYDCGGTDEMADVMDAFFECGETYFWRVFAFAGNVSGHSEVESFVMDCP